MGPDESVRIGACDVRVLGTIAGFVPDAARVEEAYAAFQPETLALGVPPEDIATLERLATATLPPELMESDTMTDRLFALLAPYGATRTPSPDLEVAYRLARAQGIQVEGVDLDDHAHADLFTRHVTFGNVLRSNARHRKLLRKGLPTKVAAGARDAYAVAKAWDAQLASTASLRLVDERREEHMANRLRVLSLRSHRLLAVLPVARLDGVMARLRSTGPSA